MAPPKRNEFLDISDSEDGGVDDHDTDDDVAKGGHRASKRRKIDSHRLDEEASGPESDSSDHEAHLDKASEGSGKEDDREDASPDNKTAGARQFRPKIETELPDITKPLTRKNLVASEKAIKKSGVVFLSRIPPFMKPAKLRSLLEPYGTINRIFLAPEDPAAHTRRVRAGGNKKRLYTEGWVEFVRKRDAKAVCELLNARIIGGKKGNYYHDDIWNLLYLKGFKWHHLTEQIASENAERTSRMRAEISKATKENKEFVRNVERAKMLDGMQAKAKKRKAGDDDAAGPAERPRTFKQVPQIKKATGTGEQPELVTRVLSRIF